MSEQIQDPNQEIYKTYIMKAYQDERINDIAWWERREKKDVVQEMFDQYLATKKDVPHKASKAA